jgi:hypothetical protein
MEAMDWAALIVFIAGEGLVLLLYIKHKHN